MGKTMSGKSNVSKIISTYMIYFVLVLLILIVSILSEGRFLGVKNIFNVLRQVTISGTLAIGMTSVLVTGGIDLSVGSVMAIAGVVATDLGHPDSGVPVIAAVGVGLLVGLIFGALNGSLIAYLKAPAFIVTLGVQSIARGIAYGLEVAVRAALGQEIAKDYIIPFELVTAENAAEYENVLDIIK